VSQQALEIETADGICPAVLFRPDAANASDCPGLLFYMDIFGPRPALDGMAQRLADQGYVVLLPDLFYREGAYEPVDLGRTLADDAAKAEVFSRAKRTTPAMTRSDSEAFIAALRREVGARRLGVVGYCMGGARAITAAGAYPDDLVAVASLHGSRLADDAPDSPHRSAAAIKARVYVGCAGVDGSFPPEQSTALADAFRRAEVDFTLENYVGCAHGWTVPDQPVFNPEGAERAFRRVCALFGETLPG